MRTLFLELFERQLQKHINCTSHRSQEEVLLSVLNIDQKDIDAKQLEKRERFFINKLKFKCAHKCKNHPMYKGTDNDNNTVQKPRMQQLIQTTRKLQTESEVKLYEQIQEDVKKHMTGKTWEEMIEGVHVINDKRGNWNNEYLMEQFINLTSQQFFPNSFKMLLSKRGNFKYKKYFDNRNKILGKNSNVWLQSCSFRIEPGQCVRRHESIYNIFYFLVENKSSIFRQAWDFIDSSNIFGEQKWDNYKVKEFVPYDFRNVEKRPEAMKDIRIEFVTSKLRSVAIDQGFNPFTSDGNLKKQGQFTRSDLFRLQPIDLNSIWQAEEELKIPKPITFGLASRKAQQFSVFE